MPTTGNWIWNLKNIKLKVYPYNFLVGRSPIRITGGSANKNNNAKDFLLTTVLKPIAPHRQILRDKLQNRSSLINHGTVKFHNSTRDIFFGEFLGDFNSHIAYPTEVPSMDLYRSHYIEIVPETFYDNCHCITEKTLKSIIAKTPFITVAPAGQLEYIRSLGFRTFNNIIDEDYDLEPDLEKRIDMILDSLEKTISKGSQQIYNDCQEILDHNHRNLMMLTGGWKYNIYLFITNTLAEITG
jgi:hypothetical protein